VAGSLSGVPGRRGEQALSRLRYGEGMNDQPERYGLLDPDEVFAGGVPGLTPIGRYAEPCLIPESDDPEARDCPLCGVRHRFTIECWGGGGPP
jgi:hypothetical protein